MAKIHTHYDNLKVARMAPQEVIPLLQERGVYRTAYEGTTMRESLGLAIPRFG